MFGFDEWARAVAEFLSPFAAGKVSSLYFRGLGVAAQRLANQREVPAPQRTPLVVREVADGERLQAADHDEASQVRGAAHVALAQDAVQERRGRRDEELLEHGLVLLVDRLELEDREEAVVQAPPVRNESGRTATI